MVRFLSELQLTPIGERRWRVTQPLVAATTYGRIVVPAGFVTDGASVPKPLWNLFPPLDGDYDAAAVLHDYAYAHAEELQLKRAQADALLYDGMVATNTDPEKRRVIYDGVRLGGHFAWQQHRDRVAAAAHKEAA